MGIYIPNIKTPKNCVDCPARHGSQCWASHCAYISDYHSLPEWCPCVPVPPHGKLIDADALEDNNITYYAIPVLANVTDGTIREAELVIRLKDLDAAPTIIPAEKGE